MTPVWLLIRSCTVSRSVLLAARPASFPPWPIDFASSTSCCCSCRSEWDASCAPLIANDDPRRNGRRRPRDLGFDARKFRFLVAGARRCNSSLFEYIVAATTEPADLWFSDLIFFFFLRVIRSLIASHRQVSRPVSIRNCALSLVPTDED